MGKGIIIISFLDVRQLGHLHPIFTRFQKQFYNLRKEKESIVNGEN